MTQSLIQQLSAAAATIRQAGTSARFKNLAQQVEQATEALRLFDQISAGASALPVATLPGIKWKDAQERSVVSFGEHSRGLCNFGMFVIKLRDCRPFINAYQLYFNGVFICSNLSFTAAKERALKHYERLLRISVVEQVTDKAPLASLQRGK